MAPGDTDDGSDRMLPFGSSAPVPEPRHSAEGADDLEPTEQISIPGIPVKQPADEAPIDEPAREQTASAPTPEAKPEHVTETKPAPAPETEPAPERVERSDPEPESAAPPAPAEQGPRKRPRPASVREGFLTVEDHLEKILRGIGPLAPYDQPLVESLGLPLHEDFVSTFELPRFTNSAMDGYAVRAEDVASATQAEPVTLPVVGEVSAGSGRPFAISAGTAVKIMTGAPLPRGADAVVPYEMTDRGNARVLVYQSVEIGAAIRPAGADVRVGDKVLEAGAVLGPREIGLLASLGVPRVKARPRPRVVIISTGSELRDPGTRLEYDSIHDGNSYMLAAAVRAAGAIAYRVGAVDDSPKAFRRVLADQIVRADLVVTSGGISQGDHDVVKETLSALGTVDFVSVAMQPGKPQGFGTVFEEKTPIITLPGNAVSAYVSFEVFVLPAIRRMMGLTPYRRPMVHAVLASDLQSISGLRQYVRAVFEVTHRGAKVTPIEGSGSHLVGALARANALIIVGEDETALHMGDTVRTLVLDRSF